MRTPILLAGLVCGLVPRTADACGGFFCNRVPVDQAGEKILFVVGGGRVTAHVQIQYRGAAEDFSWVVPVTAIPEIRVGTDEIFDILPTLSTPYLQTEYRGDFCDAGYFGGADADTDADTDADAEPSGDAPPPTVQIVSSATVGPFDTIVLDSNDPEALTRWLVDNDYDVPLSAEPLIAAYVAEGSYFLGLKLTKGADEGDLQPIVLDIPGIEACIPLRLTAIAAVEDMPVDAWFLADGRVVSTNFPEVVLSEPRFRGWEDASLVSEAVDEAGGRAFVTDHSGSSCELADRIETNRFCTDAFRHLRTPQSVMTELARQGFGGTATLLAVLEEFMPPPLGIEATSYYDCPTCYPAGPLDANGLASGLETRIVAPLREIEGLLRDRPWITALHTVLSPHEMTEDPRFAVNRSLEPVSRARQELRVLHCGSEPRSRADDVDEIVTESRHRYCQSAFVPLPDGLPPTERIVRNFEDGPGEVLVSHRADTDALLAASLPCAGPAPIVEFVPAEIVPTSCEIAPRAPRCPPPPDRPRGTLCSVSPGSASDPLAVVGCFAMLGLLVMMTRRAGAR